MARFESSPPRHKLRSLRALALVCGSSFVFWLTTACQTSCGNSNQQPIRYVDGRKYTDGPWQIYETTPYDGEWLHFPSYRRFSLEHNLGTKDITPFMWIAFDSHPIPLDGDAGDVAPATGDVAIIESIGPNAIQIRNDTCSEQYLYVKILAPNAAFDVGPTLDGGVTP